MPYQNFDDRPGGSRSQEKLAHIMFPRDLSGKRVLDLGCNEGFFCIEAKRRGASYVLGVDANPKPIALARARAASEGLDIDFAVCDFTEASNGPFDLVLLLSALHYAEDPKAVFERVHQLLAPGGLLILECGVSDFPGRQLRRVIRSIDERYFPSLELLRDHWLQDFCVRRQGRSVDQSGDPMPRFVFHCTKRKPSLVFIGGPGGTGKTSIAAHFKDAFLIETDAILSPPRHKASPPVPKPQAAMDAAMLTHNRNVARAWKEVRENSEIVRHFAGVIGKMIALNRKHDLVVVEGYIVEDVAPALAAYFRDSHMIWNLSAGLPASAGTGQGRDSEPRGKVRLNGEWIVGWAPTVDGAIPDIEILKNGEIFMLVKPEWFRMNMEKPNEAHFRIGVADLATEGASGTFVFRVRGMNRKLKGPPIEL